MTTCSANDMIHEARIIRLDRREHLPATIRQWKGDGIGRWEGDTLVVDTTNFNDQTTLRGSGSQLHVVERFCLDGPDTLRYQFTIDDPAFVKSSSADSALARTDGRMFEYACPRGQLLDDECTQRRPLLRAARYTANAARLRHN